MRRNLSFRFVKSKFIRVNSDFICEKSLRKWYSINADISSFLATLPTDFAKKKSNLLRINSYATVLFSATCSGLCRLTYPLEDDEGVPTAYTWLNFIPEFLLPRYRMRWKHMKLVHILKLAIVLEWILQHFSQSILVWNSAICYFNIEGRLHLRNLLNFSIYFLSK